MVGIMPLLCRSDANSRRNVRPATGVPGSKQRKVSYADETGKRFSREDIFARGYFREKIFSREDIFAGRYFRAQ